VGRRPPLGSSPRRMAARIASASRRYSGPSPALVQPRSDGSIGFGIGIVDILLHSNLARLAVEWSEDRVEYGRQPAPTQARLVGRLEGGGGKEAGMVRWRTLPPIARSGLLLCALLPIAIMGWAFTWAWVAVPAALGLLGVAAEAIGVDSRAPGDWTRPDSP
jgi:hypothetical protein